MKLFVFYIYLLLSFNVHADLGMAALEQEEAQKAPPWPEKYSGDVTKCNAPKVDALLTMLNKKENHNGSQEYVVNSFIDLNADSLCEVVVFDKNACEKWCDYRLFQYENQEFSDIGEIMLGEYLEPIDGWLQIKAGAYTGNVNLFFLLAKKNGMYKIIRTDEFHQNIDEKLIYVSTRFNK